MFFLLALDFILLNLHAFVDTQFLVFKLVYNIFLGKKKKKKKKLQPFGQIPVLEDGDLTLFGKFTFDFSHIFFLFCYLIILLRLMTILSIIVMVALDPT